MDNAHEHFYETDPTSQQIAEQYQTVVVLDFGGQYSALIARRIREAGVFCELHPYYLSFDQIKARAPAALVLSGGSISVYDPQAPRADRRIFDMGIPILGVCYGMQLMADELGGKVSPAAFGEFGATPLKVREPGQLLAGLPTEHQCWMSHTDEVRSLPPSFQATAQSPVSSIAAFEDAERRFVGIQFHPEAGGTPYGGKVLENFLFGVAGLLGDWTRTSFIETAVEAIQEEVGDDQVLCAVSGGVDATVALRLCQLAIPNQLNCVLIDHGLFRDGEVQEIVRLFDQHFALPLVVVDAKEQFLSRLDQIDDPESKRKIIGQEFINSFAEIAPKFGNPRFLMQGTVYSDVIESGTEGTQTIKTHHNVGGLPEVVPFDLLEPLRTLFKDEVRKLALELEFEEEFLWRHPSPGPGLAVRIVGGAVTEGRLLTLRKAEAILQQEIKDAGLSRELWQSFCILQAGIRSIGTQGDGRSYEHPIVIRTVTSEDSMTADWGRIPEPLLTRISQRITNEIPNANRVVLDITAKPPGCIEWE